jgi:branched-chain amino acid transport system permease protein
MAGHPTFTAEASTPAVRAVLITAGIAILLVAPHLFYPIFLMKLLCFALFACAFNLMVGPAGLLSFGHAAFFGSAAYVAAHTAKVWGFPFEAAVLSGMAVAAVIGLIFGIISIRQQGLFFAMITLALAQMIYFLAVQLPFTHSEDGIQSVPRGHLFGVIDLNRPLAMYYTVAGIFLIGYVFIYRVVHSPFGRVLTAIRENQPRAVSLGYRVEDFKLVALVLSAGLSGLAGATKAIAFQFASLTDVHWVTSGDVILMTLLGGIGTMFGPVVGAVVIVSLDEFLAESGIPILPIIGATFMLCILLFPNGIVGEVKRLQSRLRLGLRPRAEQPLGDQATGAQ